MARHQVLGSVLGLDVGTTTVTCAALVPGGTEPVPVVSRPVLRGRDEDGQPRPDPSSLLDACDEALRACVAAVDGRVTAVGVSADPCPVVGLDRAGRPLTGVLTGTQARAAELAAGLRRMPVGLHLLRATGRPVRPGSPLAALMWSQDRDPELCGRVHAWVGLQGLVLHHLTGRLLVDRTSATASGLLDVATGTWHEGALELAGVGPEQLPRIVETTEILEVDPSAGHRTGLPAGTPVAAGAASHVCGVLGAVGASPGAADLALDRAGRLHVVSAGDPPARLPDGLSGSVLWQGRWVVGGELGGAWGPVPCTAPDVLERAGRTPHGAGGLTVLPHLPDDVSPVWEGSLPGAVLGLAPYHRAEHLARAVLEARALQVAVLLEAVVRLTGDVGPLDVRGGHLEHRWQLETLAAVLDRPVRTRAGPPPRAVGAAALALHGLGVATSPEAAGALLTVAQEPPVTVEPDPGLVDLHADRRRRLADLAGGLGAAAGRLAHVR
ncbi:FGGY family carbohydrate kinase [Ornithinimicrobium pekingense]|uniref:Gluconate kinase n=1 Tax=Ornithinimicrobium pekingense TaxID=384677 RepID=A0ABQ2F568_9MICO|nr:FGGY family carbohydrate kinase [Ornithinimicrobium pekingense]GGK62098.1 gluconate kinase [Ornithinimicrobium pekingense]